MNTEEKIKIMQAWLDGKTIGWQGSDITWTKPDEPMFHPSNTYHVVEPTTKLSSEWFKELPEHIQWALPEYEDVICVSLHRAVDRMSDWDKTPQGSDFWLRVHIKDYPTRAETVLATWEEEKVRLKYWSKGAYFIPKTVGDGGVWGVDQDGIACYLAFDHLKDWGLYTEPERKLIDPVRLLGKILHDGDSMDLVISYSKKQKTISVDYESWKNVESLEEQGIQWSDTVDSERHSMRVKAEGVK